MPKQATLFQGALCGPPGKGVSRCSGGGAFLSPGYNWAGWGLAVTSHCLQVSGELRKQISFCLVARVISCALSLLA